MSISTKRGDTGTTGLLYGGRVRKDSVRIECNGAVDEAQAALGYARAVVLSTGVSGPGNLSGDALDGMLVSIERDLWVLMAEVATSDTNRSKLVAGSSLVTTDMVEVLTGRVHALEAQQVVPKEFVVPGENLAGAALDIARTVVRRAERLAVAAELPKASFVVPYLNRLSDLCWLLARAVEREHLAAREHAGDAHPTFAPPLLERQHASRRAMMARMNVELSVASAAPQGVSASGHLVFEGLVPSSSGLEIDRGACELRGFAGKAGESLVERDGDGLRVLVGAGERSALAPKSLRQAAATFARAVSRCQSACLQLGTAAGGEVSAGAAVQAVAEGIGGATYRFSRYRGAEPAPQLSAVTVVVEEGDVEAATAGLERGVAVAEAVALARDLINTPAADMTPSRLAEIAGEIAESAGLVLSVLDEKQIRAEHLGGLWGVASGSSEPPRLIKLTYEPAGASTAAMPTVVLVGKGITFDSGGLSLKSGEGMMTMKDDMSGAAAVIATLGACKAAGVNVRVIGIAPCTENMPSGTATKPGDVLTTRNGKTIEVLNTDAEGRLVLADGLALAVEEEPDSIIDVATLTGACVVALGPDVAGVMGNDSRVMAAVEQAAERAGEPVWHLPLPQAYKRMHESTIADMKNIGRPGGPGALLAGLILEEFVGDRPWAHIDIAGPSFTDEDSYDQRKGGTGFGVRTLIELLRNYEAIGAPADHAADGSVR